MTDERQVEMACGVPLRISPIRFHGPDSDTLSQRLNARCEHSIRSWQSLLFVLSYVADDQCVCGEAGEAETCVACEADWLLRESFGIENYHDKTNPM